MDTILLIFLVIILFLVYCTMCIGLTCLIDYYGLAMWAKAFPHDEQLWQKYWWYKFAIFGYLLLLTIIPIIGAIKIAAMVLY